MYAKPELTWAALAATAVVFAYPGESRADPPPTAANPPTASVTATGAAVEEVTITGHFVDTGASSAMKMDVPVRDTPFSVSAYTGDFMKAIQTTQIADLYRYMTGLQKAGSTGYDLTMRGFATTDSDRNAIMTDGLPGLAVRFGSPPTAGIDHIEIVRGSASLLYGMVQPGGFVNIISKKPQDTAATVLSVRGTTGASSRDTRVSGGDIAIDSTGPIDTDGKVLYRVVAQQSDDTKFRNNSYEKGEYLAPGLTWRITDRTTLTALAEYRAAESNYASFFLLAPRKLSGGGVGQLAPITTNYMAPNNYLHERGLTQSLFLTHRFDNDATWNVSYRDVDHRDTAQAYDMTGFDKKDPTLQTIDIRARGQKNHRSYRFGDTNLVLPFEFLGIGHRVIAGLSLGREVDDFKRMQFCRINSPATPVGDPSCNPTAAQYTVSVINPNFSVLPPLNYFGPGKLDPSFRSENYVTGLASGAYISDLMTLSEQWKATVGLRYARERQANVADLFEATLPNNKISMDTSHLLPQAGLIYQPNAQWSLYGSYSTSFTPVPPGTFGANGQTAFTPTLGNGYEAGAKAALLDGKVNMTFALFQIRQKDLIEPYTGDPAGCPAGNCSEQVGAAESKGAELEVSANPLPNWTLVAGLAHTVARITSSNPLGPLVGGMLPNSPVNAAHLWSRYDFTSGSLDGAGVGLGLSYVGDRVPYTPTASFGEFKLPSYEVVDLAFYYTVKQGYDFSLKFSNLFDKAYYASGLVTAGMVNAQPGTPRTATLTMTARF